MTDATDKPQNALDEAAREFVEAQLRGEQPDLNEFVKGWPGQELQLKAKVRSCQQVGALLDSLRCVDAGEFDSIGDPDLVGRKVGPLDVFEVVGRGGMGVVYKARDTKLGRVVAVKTMPLHLAQDATARARFRREAEILASLSHPHIGVIHDIVEQDDGSCYLVLEYVPGVTLSERLREGRLSPKETLRIGAQIAGALAAAYDQGVIHRDLKPGNVILDGDGNIKVLDFGIAKAARTTGDRSGTALTQHGHLLGTPAYMSPEQARGLPIDHRTDVWAFGCVLYEMLAGKIAFEGGTVSDTIAHVLERDPDWTALPPDLPHNVAVLLRRCLEKEPHNRLQHIGDAAVEIRETLSPPSLAPPLPAAAPGAGRLARVLPITASLVCLILGTVAGALLWRSIAPNEKAEPVLAASFVVDRGTAYPGLSLFFPALALSPDGSILAYVAEDTDGRRRVFVRPLDGFDARALEGTEGAVSPFFSPDGQWIAYDDHHSRKLKKVAIDGGVPVTLADAPDFRGGTWTAGGDIIFVPEVDDGLYRMPASGGTPERMTTPDPNKGERRHLWPQILPDNDSVLFTCIGSPRRFEVLSLGTGRRHALMDGGGFAHYDSSTRHLLYARDWSLYAVRLDVGRLRVQGPHRMVASEVWQSSAGTSQFAIAANGILAYIPGKWDTRKLRPVWVTRDGRQEPLALPPHNYQDVRISPNGDKVALCSYASSTPHIWVYDKNRGTTTDITGEQRSFDPTWAGGDPDTLFYGTPNGLASWSTEGQTPMRWGRIPYFRKLCDCSPDGRNLLIQLDDPNGFQGWHDLWTVASADGNDPQPVPFERTHHKQARAVWSPCGRWIAYESDEAGRHGVYVKPYPGPGARVAVSPEGGREPLWSPDGKELYYRHKGRMMAVQIETKSDFKVVSIEPLFDDVYYSCIMSKTCDIGPDGRFLMLADPHASEQSQIRVVLHWPDLLQRRSPQTSSP
ncbi:MAG: serine/threonine-protein kinase [Sedimentisphaerales bacterium]|nr:serine/threonine-protein kinase [Sedimentisphaerales bacterium]